MNKIKRSCSHSEDTNARPDFISAGGAPVLDLILVGGVRSQGDSLTVAMRAGSCQDLPTPQKCRNARCGQNKPSHEGLGREERADAGNQDDQYTQCQCKVLSPAKEKFRNTKHVSTPLSTLDKTIKCVSIHIHVFHQPAETMRTTLVWICARRQNSTVHQLSASGLSQMLWVKTWHSQGPLLQSALGNAGKQPSYPGTQLAPEDCVRTSGILGSNR